MNSPAQSDVFRPSTLKNLPAANAQFLPLCFDNDMNCSPRNPFALITIQIPLPYTKALRQTFRQISANLLPHNDLRPFPVLASRTPHQPGTLELPVSPGLHLAFASGRGITRDDGRGVFWPLQVGRQAGS
jgi:hypothetical protein